MVERFVSNGGTISVANGASTVVGVGTLFSGRDRAGAKVYAYPSSVAVPVVVGTVAEVDPRGVYENLSLPLVTPYRGATLTAVEYELVDGAAIANGATQAAIYARFAAFLEENMGLVGNSADDIDYTLIPNNTLIVNNTTRRIYQWRNGVLEITQDVTRELLSANRTYYVRTDGNNANTGLVDSAGGAFLTAQKAMDVITSTLDVAGFTVTVQIRNGTNDAGVDIKNWIGGGVIHFKGNEATPGLCYFDVVGHNIFDASFGALPGIVRITGIQMRTTTSGYHIISRSPGRLQYSNIIFGTAPQAHVVAAVQGFIEPYGNNTIEGGSGAHWIAGMGGKFWTRSLDLPTPIGTLTISGNPTFDAFAVCVDGAIANLSGVTFSGGALGTRFYQDTGGILITGGGGPNYFPGSFPGAGVIF